MRVSRVLATQAPTVTPAASSYGGSRRKVARVHMVFSGTSWARLLAGRA